MTASLPPNLPRRRLLAASGLAGLAGLGLPLSTRAAAGFPHKPVKVICAFPPGNASDIVARMLGEHLGKRWKQPVVVDNRPGASGIIAANAVQKSPADGLTLLMTSTSFVINGSVMKSAGYDIEKDFAPVSLINSIPVVLLTRKDFPAKNFAEFVELARKNPGKYSYGHPGIGTIHNMTMKLLMGKLGLDMVEVPYKGSVQAITDIVGGVTDVMFEAANSAYTFVDAGRVKALATSGPQPYFALPTVPTLKQSGVDVNVVGFTAMMAPAGTPKDVTDFINAEIKTVLAMPQMISGMQTAGLEVYPQMSASDVGHWMVKESARWETVARAANISKE